MYYYVKTPSGIIFTVEAESEEAAKTAVSETITGKEEGLVVTEEEENEETVATNQTEAEKEGESEEV